MEKLILLDLFSGIGGFPLGLMRAGFSFHKHYFSEINHHSIAVYKKQFKNVEYVGSVEHVFKANIERPHIITFGSPCQDFSIAGERAGLDGERSSLIEYALASISYFKPDLFIWENVKGAFSSNDSTDFWAIIQAFANIGGYRIEWQLLNTAWVLPQNRERIYLVGYSTNKGTGGQNVFPVTSGAEEAYEKHVPFGSGANINPAFKISMSEGERRNYSSSHTIRDLTPIEYERLQGFPDNWTKYGAYDESERELTKGVRYNLLGNAVSVPIVQMVGSRINTILEPKDI